MSGNSCLFCRIAAGEIPSQKVYEDELVFAFRDIDPQAPVHILIIPKKHIADIGALTEEDAAVSARLFEVAGLLARQEGIADSGYRVVSNVGADGGQSVPHLHLHLLGGRVMTWPAG